MRIIELMMLVGGCFAIPTEQRSADKDTERDVPVELKRPRSSLTTGNTNDSPLGDRQTGRSFGRHVEDHLGDKHHHYWSLFNGIIVGGCDPILIEQNVNGSRFFNRSWQEFKVGFGDPRGNYWIGNEALSQLTMQRRYSLKLDLQSHANLNWYKAQYSTFRVLNESNNHTLEVSGYSGNLNTGTEGFSSHNGMMFSTYDRDNDHSESDCAANYRGAGFWYKYCLFCNVNSDRGRVYEFRCSGLPRGGSLQSARMWILCE